MDAPPPVWSDDRPLAILATASALPGPAVATGDLIAGLEARFGLRLPAARRIADRLAITHRHIARDLAARRESPRPGCANADLAARAVRNALAAASLEPGDLDYLIGHSATPGRQLPSNIAFVADRLGYRGPYLELRQACTGFAGALVIAQGLLGRAGARAVAIVGSETGSLFFDPLRAGVDHGQLVNYIQMGDGAGAVIVARADHPAATGEIGGVFSGQIGIGRAPGLTLAAGGSDQPFIDTHVAEFAHDFAAVRATGPALFMAAAAAAAALGYDPRMVGRIIPHQANGRMAHLLAPVLDVPASHVFVNADRLGNTGSAAIWLAFDALRTIAPPGLRIAVLGAEATKHMFGGFGYIHG